MAYGRLDIFWPDGNFQSFTLDQPTVSVGRAPGNTIALDTETISRYHFSLIHEDDTVTLTDLDSENGTFVDGQRLVSNEGRILDGVEEIVIGQLRIIYHPLDESPTMPMSRARDDDTQRIERREVDFLLDVDVARMEVWPAASSSTELSITNTGDQARIFRIKVTGVPESWVRVNRLQVQVEPKETAYVLINIKPPRRPDTRPQTYQGVIQVIAQDDANTYLEAPLEVSVRAYGGFGMALTPARAALGEPMRLYLHNQGSDTLPLKVDGVDATDTLDFDLPDGRVVLAAGQRMQVALRVTTRRPITGSAVERPFDVRVHAQDDAGFLAAVRGRVVVTPLLPVWGAISVGGIAVSALLILMLALAGLLAPPPEPQVTTVTLSGEQIPQGDPLVVSWEAEDAERFVVSMNQVLVAELDGDARSVEIDTTELHGNLSVEVQAENRGVFAAGSAAAFVYRPLVVDYFIAEPDELVRNVVASVNVSWRVSGAIRTRISGIEEFSNGPLRLSYDDDEVMLNGISGIAQGPVSLVLVAEDEVGNVIEERLDLNVIDPVCLTRESVQLYEGPDLRYQTISTVQGGQSLVVDAQDIAAGWLRMELPGNVRGWAPRENFLCNDNFALENLRTIADVPPLPTATPSSTPSATPTVTPTPSPTTTPTVISTPGL